MKAVTVRSMVLSAGRTRIAMSLVTKDSDGLIRAAAQLHTLDLDLTGFRADFLRRTDEADSVLTQLEKAHEALLDMPLLFTLRHAAKSGPCPYGNDCYFALLRRAVKSGPAGITDIELLAGDGPIGGTATQVKTAGAAVLLCNHSFKHTPPKDVTAGRPKRMEALSADICEVIVVPQPPQDVLTPLDTTYSISQTVPVPFVAASMSRLGMVSRIAGGMLGSAMAFATTEKASTPGQISVGELRNILDILDG